MPVAERFSRLTKKRILIIIMLLIGLALILDAGLKTYRNWNHAPFLLISIAGFIILALIYWFWGEDW
jgi:predicted Na+-dependent transporter